MEGTEERSGIVSRTSVAEAAAILLVAAILGFLYSGVTGRGFFRPSQAGEGTAGGNALPPGSVSFQEARELYLQGALFIDARYSEDFALGHIQGAINVPLEQFDELQPLLAYLPRDTLIVTYCDGSECNSSAELALKLRAEGFSNVKVFFGGWKDWVAHQQPREP